MKLLTCHMCIYRGYPEKDFPGSVFLLRQSLFLLLISVFLIAGCGNTQGDPAFLSASQNRPVPAFSADSSYHFIVQQVGFGPRNPGSDGHAKARNFLLETLREYAGPRAVYEQTFTHTGYEGDVYPMSNIIAAFRPDLNDRILLCAHWDTRPRAERDPDPEKRHEPILGADDGGSGVGVLLELARIFQENPPPVGVDIILFDGEDYGHEGDLDFYFLGSRHWANHPPVPGYRPRFGILLDMVGARNARFPREGYSMHYAPQLVEQVWKVAADLGHENLFLDSRGSRIADDHWIINRKTGIPTINIINHNPNPGRGRDDLFPDYWHTHKDNLDIIDKQTLQAVGDVLVELIYNRIRKQS